MTIFQARLITNTLTEEFSYEIYGKDIPSSDAVVEAWNTYAEYEKGCEGDKLSCFSTYSANHQIVEMVAWSESDSKHVIALLNVRMAIHVTMTFMAWYWRNQYQTARAKEEKSPTLDYAIDADSGLARFRQVIEIAHAHAKSLPRNQTDTQKSFRVDSNSSLLLVWNFLMDGIPFETDFEGERFTLAHHVDYEENKIYIVLTTIRTKYFVKTWKELYTLIVKLEILNSDWRFSK